MPSFLTRNGEEGSEKTRGKKKKKKEEGPPRALRGKQPLGPGPLGEKEKSAWGGVEKKGKSKSFRVLTHGGG